MNVERSAAQAGVTPKELADRNSALFRRAWDHLDVRPDRFLRTTEPDHRRAAHALWNRLDRAGALRRGVYEGFYCVPCEAFLAEADLVAEDRCPVHGSPCEWQREGNTFLRLSKQTDALRTLIAETEFIKPSNRRAEVLGWLHRGVPDLSLTRSSVRWGIPAPDLPGEVLYVFGVDALTNYLTGQGFPEPDAPWRQLFPQTTHVIGKEILRFHALSWPGLLRAARLPLPKELRVHGHFTIEGEKISKTRGNTIDPVALTKEFGADVVRFFLLRSKPFDRDGDFSLARGKAEWNAELAGGLGNWAQRIFALPQPTLSRAGASPSSDDAKLLTAAERAGVATGNAYEDFDFVLALRELGSLVAVANRHLERVRPWELAKQRNPGALRRLGEALAAHRNALAVAARCVAPITPRGAEALTARLGSNAGAGPPIFPKLE